MLLFAAIIFVIVFDETRPDQLLIIESEHVLIELCREALHDAISDGACVGSNLQSNSHHLFDSIYFYTKNFQNSQHVRMPVEFAGNRNDKRRGNGANGTLWSRQNRRNYFE